MQRHAQFSQLLYRDQGGDYVLANTVIDEDLPDRLRGNLCFALSLVQIQHLFDGACNKSELRACLAVDPCVNHSLICFSFSVTIMKGCWGLWETY